MDAPQNTLVPCRKLLARTCVGRDSTEEEYALMSVNVYFVVSYFLKNIRAPFHAWFALRICLPVRVYVIIPYVSAPQNNFPNAESHQIEPVYVEVQNQDRFSYNIFIFLPITSLSVYMIISCVN